MTPGLRHAPWLRLYENSVLKLARRRFGPVAIANTDAGGDAWVHYAIDQADRAVKELLG